MTPDWFPGEGRHADDEAFLARLRARAAAAGVGDAEVGSSWAGDAGGLVAACVRVPGAPVEGVAPDLQVGLARDTTGWVLLGQWALSDHVLDLPETIDIDHVPRTPEGLADRAFDWLVGQLARPVERLEWTSGHRPPRIELRLRDPDELLALPRSGWPFRRRPGEPERVTRLR